MMESLSIEKIIAIFVAIIGALYQIKKFLFPHQLREGLKLELDIYRELKDDNKFSKEKIVKSINDKLEKLDKNATQNLSIFLFTLICFLFFTYLTIKGFEEEPTYFLLFNMLMSIVSFFSLFSISEIKEEGDVANVFRVEVNKNRLLISAFLSMCFFAGIFFIVRFNAIIAYKEKTSIGFLCFFALAALTNAIRGIKIIKDK